jgi:hypothetical protein
MVSNRLFNNAVKGKNLLGAVRSIMTPLRKQAANLTSR